MKVFGNPGFWRALKRLPEREQTKVLAAARQLPEVFGQPHLHVGLGIRRFGKYFEFRVGLPWRVLFVMRTGDAHLVTVGNHDDIRRFVKSN